MWFVLKFQNKVFYKRFRFREKMKREVISILCQRDQKISSIAKQIVVYENIDNTVTEVFEWLTFNKIRVSDKDRKEIVNNLKMENLKQVFIDILDYVCVIHLR